MSTSTEYLLPPPDVYGLPYDQWRNGQDRAVLHLVDAPTRFVIGSMPTGFGKSLVYTAAGQLLGGRGCILTSTKGLQAQLTRDFGQMGMVEIRGQNSYECRALAEPGGAQYLDNPSAAGSGRRHPDDRVSCDEGPCKVGVKCSLMARGCHYYDAMSTARSASLVVTNYSMWMTAHRYLGPKEEDKRNRPGINNGLGPFDYLILDEAHDAPDQLASFLTIEVNAWEVEGMLGTKFLGEGADTRQWVDWANYHRPRAEAQLKLAEESAKLGDRKAMKKAVEWRRLEGKLGLVSSDMRDGWLAVASTYGRNRSVKFAPIQPAPYAEANLFLNIPKVMMVSATCNRKTASLVGIKSDQLTYEEWPSTFPVDRRPIYHVPTIRLNNRTSDVDLRTWLNRIDQIIDKRLDRKGIIHTVSYARRTLVYANSRHSDIMTVHDSDDARVKVERFKRAHAPAVLVSPSVSTGYDFPYAECEYVIIGKLPFPDTRDPVLKARTEIDDEYSAYLTVQDMVQAAGRGMRAADDMCEVFIIDDSIRWFSRMYKHLIPKWFQQAIKWAQVIPAPPAALGQADRSPSCTHCGRTVTPDTLTISIPICPHCGGPFPLEA